ncbi:hypothetical protein [Phormidesmis sp. 146-33]
MENFNETAFDELLRKGEIHDALEMRLEDLEVKAGGNCAEIEAAKISSAAMVITGFVLATPVTAVFAGMGAIAYLYSVASDFHQTHKFALFPLVRTGFGDLLSGVGLAATGHSKREDADDIARAESYLSPRESKEYRLLATNPDRVSKWLLEQPAEKRSLAYKSLTRNLGVKQISASTTQTPQPVLGESPASPVQTQPTPEFSQPDAASNSPTNKSELLDRLKVECPSLLRLIKSQPIRAVGTQRTGKTTLVKKMALLRMLLLQNHSVIASTPHYEPENPYPSVFKVVGWKNNKRDYTGIAAQLNAMSERIENGDRSSITTVWDEFGLFDRVMDGESLTAIITSSLREATKHGEYPVFIVHGETQAFLPGTKGLVTVFLSSTVRVETIGELVTGVDGLDEMKPTGKFKIKWLDGNTEEGQIPSWLTEEFLISLLPDSVIRRSQAVNTQEKPAETSSKSETSNPVDQLNKMWNSDTVTPPHEEEEMSLEVAGTILKVADDLGSYIKSRTDVAAWNVSSVKKANKKFRQYGNAFIIKAFQILAISDEGRWDGEKFIPR